MRDGEDCSLEGFLEREKQREIEEAKQAQRDAALFATANAQLEQIKLLNGNLIEAQKQNEQMFKAYQNARKEAERNKILSIISIGIAGVSLIVAIILGILK